MGLTADEWEALPPVLTPEQVGAVLGMSRLQVIRLASAGELTASKLGRQWRFPKSALGPSGDYGTGASGRADRPGSR